MIKEQLLKFCWDYVGEKAQRLKNSNADLQESLDSETKNSTGDKHETGRAMVQLEQEKLAQQFTELERTKSILQRVDVRKRSETIGLGSLVRTNAADYFIAISAGAFKQEGKPIYCISQEAPIAQLLMGKKKDETFVFNGNSHTVLEVG
ncbi:GreA/GreB family elongation factor [Flagellimonas amoyensis]|uniref:GreA/GreB family elongation factor n=1 Tax=Flagellimonas amoyensis TaxID=2169401 RepID=UPI001F41227F|nr:GreA/GreB family elongation factor [Allomuricauda amoyensis]